MPDSRTYYIDGLHESRYVRVTQARDPHVIAHSHDFLELTYVLDGEATHTVDGVSGTLRRGDYFLIDIRQTHSYDGLPGVSALPVINIDFSPRYFDLSLAAGDGFDAVLGTEIIRFSHIRLKQSPAGLIFHDSGGNVRERFMHAFNESRTRTNGWREMVRADAVNILITMLRQSSYSKAPALHRTYVAYLTEYVDRHYAEQITLSELCRRMNYSLSHVSRGFRAETGKTFSGYLQQVRITQSCSLLKSSGMTVEEICEAVGYHNTAFFYRIFKEATGMTPLDFRRHANK